MEFEETTTTIILAQKAIAEDDITKFLEQCYVLFEIKNKDKEKKRVKKYLEDQELMRKINAIKAVTETSENKAYYYSEDRGIGDPFEYKEETERTITKIRLEFLDVISAIIKEEEDQEISVN